MKVRLPFLVLAVLIISIQGAHPPDPPAISCDTSCLDAGELDGDKYDDIAARIVTRRAKKPGKKPNSLTQAHKMPPVARTLRRQSLAMAVEHEKLATHFENEAILHGDMRDNALLEHKHAMTWGDPTQAETFAEKAIRHNNEALAWNMMATINQGESEANRALATRLRENTALGRVEDGMPPQAFEGVDSPEHLPEHSPPTTPHYPTANLLPKRFENINLLRRCHKPILRRPLVGGQHHHMQLRRRLKLVLAVLRSSDQHWQSQVRQELRKIIVVFLTFALPDSI